MNKENYALKLVDEIIQQLYYLTQFLLHPYVFFFIRFSTPEVVPLLVCNYMALAYICLVLLIFLLDCHIILFIYPRLK